MRGGHTLFALTINTLIGVLVATNLISDVKNSSTKALLHALRANDIASIEKLLGSGISPDCVDPELGYTPLMIAAREDNAHIIEVLIAHGAKVDFNGNVDRTPLMIAAENSGVNTIQALIKAGADVNHKSKFGATPLIFALGKCRPDVVTILLENGADINAQTFNGATALIIAASNGDSACTRLLLDRGADTTIKDSQGYSALRIALVSGHFKVVKLLVGKLFWLMALFPALLAIGGWFCFRLRRSKHAPGS